MPLNISRLAANINEIMDDYDNIIPEDKAAKRLDFSTKLATVLINEIKQLQIVYTAGLVAGQTAVTGSITHTVN